MHTPRILTLALTLFLATETLAGDNPLDPNAARQVTVQNVALQGDTVSGTVVNASPHPVRGVQLDINYAWLWKDERHPGGDSPGRTDSYTLPGEIPAGGSLPFTYRPPSPLPSRTDGHFTASASVAAFTDVVPARP